MTWQTKQGCCSYVVCVQTPRPPWCLANLRRWPTANHLVSAKSKIESSYHISNVLRAVITFKCSSYFVQLPKGVSEQQVKRQVRTGLKEKWGVERKRRCNTLISGSSAVMRVWWLVSVNTHAVRFPCCCQKMVDEVSVCISSSALSVSGVRVSVTVKTHTHTSRAESPGMGDTDTCLSLRRLTGFLSSENGWLFPRSQSDPSAAFISLSLSLSP